MKEAISFVHGDGLTNNGLSLSRVTLGLLQESLAPYKVYLKDRLSVIAFAMGCKLPNEPIIRAFRGLMELHSDRNLKVRHDLRRYDVAFTNPHKEGFIYSEDVAGNIKLSHITTDCTTHSNWKLYLSNGALAIDLPID